MPLFAIPGLEPRSLALLNSTTIFPSQHFIFDNHKPDNRASYPVAALTDRILVESWNVFGNEFRHFSMMNFRIFRVDCLRDKRDISVLWSGESSSKTTIKNCKYQVNFGERRCLFIGHVLCLLVCCPVMNFSQSCCWSRTRQHVARCHGDTEHTRSVKEILNKRLHN